MLNLPKTTLPTELYNELKMHAYAQYLLDEVLIQEEPGTTHTHPDAWKNNIGNGQANGYFKTIGITVLLGARPRSNDILTKTLQHLNNIYPRPSDAKKDCYKACKLMIAPNIVPPTNSQPITIGRPCIEILMANPPHRVLEPAPLEYYESKEFARYYP